MAHRRPGIALYCIFVGASASVVRAGIMGILLVLGPAFGRCSMTLNALAISSLVMAVRSPLALWNVGFQLSFAATPDMIVMATPLITAYQQWLVRRVPSVALRMAVLSSLRKIRPTARPIISFALNGINIHGMPLAILTSYWATELITRKAIQDTRHSRHKTAGHSCLERPPVAAIAHALRL